MTAPAGDPDYNPDTWKLGYQDRQFGMGADPVPTGSSGGSAPYPSAYGALADPPATMTTAIEKAIPA